MNKATAAVTAAACTATAIATLYATTYLWAQRIRANALLLNINLDNVDVDVGVDGSEDQTVVSCATCRYSVMTGHQEGAFMRCMLMPPQVVTHKGGFGTIQPTVDETNYCWQWESTRE